MLRNGLDPACRPVAEGLAHGRDLKREVRLVDEGVWPQRGHEFLLGERITGLLDEKHQEVQGLRREWQDLPRSSERALREVQTVRAELVQIADRTRHSLPKGLL